MTSDDSQNTRTGLNQFPRIYKQNYGKQCHNIDALRQNGIKFKFLSSSSLNQIPTKIHNFAKFKMENLFCNPDFPVNPICKIVSIVANCTNFLFILSNLFGFELTLYLLRF